MGNKRFSATTYVLVGISLAALYFVGKSVNPPPPAPAPLPTTQTSPVKPPPANVVKPDSAKPDPAAQAREDARVKAQRLRNDAALQKPKPAKLTKAGEPVEPFNPNTIQTNADYWHQNQMGKQGEEQMDMKVAAAKKAEKPTPPKRAVGIMPPAP